MGALSDFIRGRFGVNTRYNPNPLTTTVGTAATKLWDNNDDRLELIFINLGVEIIYLNTVPQVSTTNGIYCAAGGGSVVLNAEGDASLVGYPWYGIAAANTVVFSAEVESIG